MIFKYYLFQKSGPTGDQGIQGIAGPTGDPGNKVIDK